MELNVACYNIELDIQTRVAKYANIFVQNDTE
jgi:hypothetical protein